MANLFLVRHGETALNREKKLRGWKDIPLDVQGKQEAERLADFFTDHDVVKIYTSDLQRAAETARVISEAVHAPVFEKKDWRPWHLGSWSGESTTKVLPDMLRCIDRDQDCPPDGEPFARFRSRVTQVLQDVQREAARASGECFVIVTHVRDIRLILGIIEYGVNSPKTLTYIKATDDPVDPGGIVEVTLSHGTWDWDLTEHGDSAPRQSQTVS